MNSISPDESFRLCQEIEQRAPFLSGGQAHGQFQRLALVLPVMRLDARPDPQEGIFSDGLVR